MIKKGIKFERGSKDSQAAKRGVLDVASGEYKPSTAVIDPLIERILKKPIGERLELLRNTEDPLRVKALAIVVPAKSN